LLHPTETVYGLAGDPFCRDAVESVHRIKETSAGKPMLAITDDWDRVAAWCAEINPMHEKLMCRADLPLTLLFIASPHAPESIVSSSRKIAIRRTASDFCRGVIQEASMPLFSTSANRTGHPAPECLEDVDPVIIAACDLAVDGGRTTFGLPSSVVDVTDGKVAILRAGAVSEEDILLALT
jgi:L-threonylcarbamoyladenylate synthase